MDVELPGPDETSDMDWLFGPDPADPEWAELQELPPPDLKAEARRVLEELNDWRYAYRAHGIYSSSMPRCTHRLCIIGQIIPSPEPKPQPAALFACVAHAAYRTMTTA